jgi:hypothetical protein
MVWYNLRWLDAGQRNVAYMLWIHVDRVMADMEEEVAVKADKPVTETEKQLTLMALMFWNLLTISWMTNGIDLDMKVAVMLFRLAVIVPTIKVEVVADDVMFAWRMWS